MARAVGAGTRLPRRERARAAGLLPGGAQERGPAGTAAGCREPRFLRQMGARNARAGALRTHGASGGRGDAPTAARAGARGGPPGGWCGRRARRNTPPGAACRVSCSLRALETLAPPAFAAKAAHATASVGWVWDPPASERIPRKYRAQHGPRPRGAGHAQQLFLEKRLTRRKDGAIIPPINAEGGRAGMKAARMDHSSAYSFTFGFTFMRKALLRCAV